MFSPHHYLAFSECVNLKRAFLKSQFKVFLDTVKYSEPLILKSLFWNILGYLITKHISLLTDSFVQQLSEGRAAFR